MSGLFFLRLTTNPASVPWRSRATGGRMKKRRRRYFELKKGDARLKTPAWKHGDIVEGRVIALDHSGAWLQANGFSIFVPLAEIAWFEIEHPSVLLKEDDEVRVKITGKDNAGDWTGSIRQLEPPSSITRNEPL